MWGKYLWDKELGGGRLFLGRVEIFGGNWDKRLFESALSPTLISLKRPSNLHQIPLQKIEKNPQPHFFPHGNGYPSYKAQATPQRLRHFPKSSTFFHNNS